MNDSIKYNDINTFALLRLMLNGDNVHTVMERDVQFEHVPPYGPDSFEPVFTPFNCYIEIDDIKCYFLSHKEMECVWDVYLTLQKYCEDGNKRLQLDLKEALVR